MTKIEHSESFCTTLVAKDGKKSRIAKIGYSKLFWTTLVIKDGEKCRIMKIRHSESFQTTLVGKNGKAYRMTKIANASSETYVINYKVIKLVHLAQIHGPRNIHNMPFLVPGYPGTA